MCHGPGGISVTSIGSATLYGLAAWHSWHVSQYSYTMAPMEGNQTLFLRFDRVDVGPVWLVWAFSTH